MAIRLMLADDHRMLREGLRRSMTDAGFDVIGEAGDGVEAVRLALQLSPDVILMDVTMPNCDGVEACRQVKSTSSDTKVVMLTMHADQDVLTNAIRAGAIGYLTKDCSTREIAEAVRMAAEGDTVLLGAIGTATPAGTPKATTAPTGGGPGGGGAPGGIR